MKKDFVRPTLERYELQLKENIASSFIDENGSLIAEWHFLQYRNSSGVLVDEPGTTADRGCYDLLIGSFQTAGHLENQGTWFSFVGGLYEDEQTRPSYLACNIDFVNGSSSTGT